MVIDPWNPEQLAIIAAIFLLAGMVKGVVGLGLPTISLALLTVTFGLKGAMVMMIVPSFSTNVWQAVSGGAFVALMRRFWLLLVLTCISIWFGAKFLAIADTRLLSGLLGLVTFIYALIGLMTPQMPNALPYERLASPLVGLVNGAITGLTGSSVMPGVPYLQALQMPRDEMIQAMGMLFSVSALALGVAMAGENLVPRALGMASLVGLVPAFGGMWLGLKVRKRISQTQFRRVLFVSLLVLGVYITVRAII
jgi:uncharacterized protein